MCVCADIVTDAMIKESEGKKKRKKKLNVNGFNQLKSALTMEEKNKILTHPIKETFAAGKTLMNVGQRFSRWITSLGRSH